MHYCRNYLFTTVFALICCFQTVAAGRIVWDESHTPIDGYGLNGEYSSLRDFLIQDDFEIEVNEDEIGVNSLWDADILIISILSNYQSAYTTSEVERIVSFVEGGGGLVILADNSQARPRNLVALVDHFGMSVANGDNIGDLTQFADHEITDGVESVAFTNGSAVAAGEDGQNLGSDEEDMVGLAIYEEAAGVVVLLGDADAWSNENIELDDNLLLAMNAVRFADRLRNGSIEIAFDRQRAILIDGYSDEFEITIHNVGDDILEVGFAIPEDAVWLQISPRYAQMDTVESADIMVTVSADGIEVGEEVSTTLTIYHNQPNAEPLEVDFSLSVISDQLQHFDVPDPTGTDHSILISNLTIGGIGTYPGIEIGAFSEDGLCVGGVIYMGEQIGLVARGDDRLTEEIDGFVNGERMHFKLFTLWDEVELETTMDLQWGDERYRADGLTFLNLDGRPSSSVTLDFNQRWNLISLNLLPPFLGFLDIFAPMIDAGMLRMIKDGNGHFWNVDREFNNLGDWDIRNGYFVQVSQFTELEVTGVEIDVNTPVLIDFGWSIIPFLPSEEMAIEPALSSIENRLVILKRDDGAFYLPAWDWDGIGNLTPGEGYKVKLFGLDTLIYPIDQLQENAFNDYPTKVNPSLSGIDMSVLLLGLEPYTSIKVVDNNGVTVGYGKSDAKGRAGIATWGDDISTDEDEGLAEGESFNIVITDQESSELSFDWLEGAAYFNTDGFSVGRLKQGVLFPNQQSVSVSPNPFNSVLTVRYSSYNSDPVAISLYDVHGRELMRKVISSMGENSSREEISLSANNLPAGVIFVKLEQGSKVTTLKTVHLP